MVVYGTCPYIARLPKVARALWGVTPSLDIGEEPVRYLGTTPPVRSSRPTAIPEDILKQRDGAALSWFSSGCPKTGVTERHTIIAVQVRLGLPYQKAEADKASFARKAHALRRVDRRTGSGHLHRPVPCSAESRALSTVGHGRRPMTRSLMKRRKP